MQDLTGARLTSTAQKDFITDPHSFKVLELDIPGITYTKNIFIIFIELKPLIKHMNISLLSSAIAISLEARTQKNERLFKTSYDKFKDASLSGSEDFVTYFEWAETYLYHSECVSSISYRMELLEEAISKVNSICKFK